MGSGGDVDTSLAGSDGDDEEEEEGAEEVDGSDSISELADSDSIITSAMSCTLSRYVTDNKRQERGVDGVN